MFHSLFIYVSVNTASVSMFLIDFIYDIQTADSSSSNNNLFLLYIMIDYFSFLFLSLMIYQLSWGI